MLGQGGVGKGYTGRSSLPPTTKRGKGEYEGKKVTRGQGTNQQDQSGITCPNVPQQQSLTAVGYSTKQLETTCLLPISHDMH